MGMAGEPGWSFNVHNKTHCLRGRTVWYTVDNAPPRREKHDACHSRSTHGLRGRTVCYTIDHVPSRRDEREARHAGLTHGLRGRIVCYTLNLSARHEKHDVCHSRSAHG